MGFIEETGVAQHYRDIRIAPIYEGTNGIQAIDLVFRKLPVDGGAVVRQLLDSIQATTAELESLGDEMAAARSQLADALAALRAATEWLLAQGASDPADALAGAAPYLRLFALVTGGWLLARSAIAARRRSAEGGGNQAFLDQKVVTARFFCEQLLPQAAALLPAVTATNRDLDAAY
jgi:hypothetical protein